jgi:hypothetical protein
MRGLLTPAFAARLDRHERTSVRQGLLSQILGLRVCSNVGLSKMGITNCEVVAILLSRLSDVNLQIAKDRATVIKL